MTNTIACDVSEFQYSVDARYPHEWLIFRACDGIYQDRKFAVNYAWARQAADSGKLAGYSVYVVFRPGVDVYGTAAALLGKIDQHVTVLIDVESWGGQIGGDHSTAITALAQQFVALLGDERRVLAYGNQGDLANIYPRRPDWLKLIVAGYGSVQPSVRNMIGWQYSDGQSKWAHPAGLPISSPPFGNCDHNVFPGLTPTALAAALGVGASDEGFVMDKEATTRFDKLDKDVEAVSTRLDGLFSDDKDNPHRLHNIVRSELESVLAEYGFKKGGGK